MILVWIFFLHSTQSSHNLEVISTFYHKTNLQPQLISCKFITSGYIPAGLNLKYKSHNYEENISKELNVIGAWFAGKGYNSIITPSITTGEMP